MSDTSPPEAVQGLASYRRCTDRIGTAWPAFAARRTQRLRQGLFGAPVEKVAENILEDLFTEVLDWDLGDVNLQIGRADIVLSALGIKRLVLEVKRPGALAWHRSSVAAALDQAMRYAAAQKVGAVAVSDGQMLYAADVTASGIRDRLFVSLDGAQPPIDLWWLSVHGIYRACPQLATSLPAQPAPAGAEEGGLAGIGELLHHKYGLPARCFAFVGAADNQATWKLPYLLVDGSPDARRLPKAIQSILSNFRGVRVNIPRESIADVLVRLGRAASTSRRMPCQCVPTADAYVEAHQALDQLGRLADVGCCPAAPGPSAQPAG